MSATAEKPAASKPKKKSRPTHYMVREQVTLYRRSGADPDVDQSGFEEVEALVELGEATTANGPRAAVEIVLKEIGREGTGGKFKAHPIISDKTHELEYETVQRPLWK